MKDNLKRLILLCLSVHDIDLKNSLQKEINNIIDDFESTFNCPSNWQDIKEELQADPECKKFVFSW